MTTDTWELRWTAAGLPALATVLRCERPSPTGSIIDDDDVYLLTGSARINLKFRRRTNTLKLKQLVHRSWHGFERWRTEFDEPLPVVSAVAERAAILLKDTTSIEPLAAATDTDRALEVIATVLPSESIVAVHKRRRLYRHGRGLVDDVRFDVGGSAFRSIGLESTTEHALHGLLADVAADRLGTPSNYMQFLYRQH